MTSNLLCGLHLWHTELLPKKSVLNQTLQCCTRIWITASKFHPHFPSCNHRWWLKVWFRDYSWQSTLNFYPEATSLMEPFRLSQNPRNWHHLSHSWQSRKEMPFPTPRLCLQPLRQYQMRSSVAPLEGKEICIFYKGTPESAPVELHRMMKNWDHLHRSVLLAEFDYMLYLTPRPI